jgi:hypothetical protein
MARLEACPPADQSAAAEVGLGEGGALEVGLW